MERESLNNIRHLSSCREVGKAGLRIRVELTRTQPLKKNRSGFGSGCHEKTGFGFTRRLGGSGTPMERTVSMILILDGNSETGAHVGINLSFFLFKAFD